MLLILLLASVLATPAPAVDEDERELLRRALGMLEGRPASEQLLATYEELHRRAWVAGDPETALSATTALLARLDAVFEPRQQGRYLNELSARVKASGDMGSAVAVSRRLVALAESVFGPDDPQLVVGLLDLANLQTRSRDLEAARGTFERCLRLAEAAHGSDHVEVGHVLAEMTQFHNLAGEPQRAVTCGERARELLARHLGAGHTSVGDVLRRLALVRIQQGELDLALKLGQAAVANAEAALGVGHPGSALALQALGHAHFMRGELDRARDCFERCIALREPLLGPGHPDLARDLGNLAETLRRMGEYAAARPLTERTLAIFEASFGPDHPQVAQSAANLAVLLRYLGDLEGARALAERAVAIHEAVGSPAPRLANDLVILAGLVNQLGELQRGRDLVVRSLALHEAAYGPDHFRVADDLNNLGFMERDLGNTDAAREAYERSLAIRERALGPDHPRVATSLAHLTSLLDQLGEFEAARAHGERGLAILEALHGPSHPHVLRAAHGLAVLHLHAGEPERARPLALRLVARREQLQRTLAALTEGESQLLLGDLAHLRDALIGVGTALGEPELGHDEVLATKGQVARLALRTREQLRSRMDPRALELADELSALQAELATLALSTDAPDPAAREQRLEALRSRRDGLERALRQHVALDGGAPARGRDVAAALPPGTALIDLFVHGVYPVAVVEDGRVVEGGGHLPEHVTAWILKPDQARPVEVALGPLAPIAAALRTHLAAIAGGGALRGRPLVERGRASPERPPGGELERLLWRPLAAHVGDVDTLLVSPDGVLATLPFETLRDDDGRYLLERFACVYLADAGSLVELGGSPGALGPALLATGGVDYGPQLETGAATERGWRGLRGGWGALPATLPEVDAVLAAHAGSRRSGRRQLLSGAEADEARLQREMPRHDVLHLATHGFFQPEGLRSLREAAREASATRGGQAPDAFEERLSGLHPGLLSGLVLAGANRPIAADGDRLDGFLTASEVTLLDLSEVELVVLSACETGLGRSRSGEGLLGLRRAFHMAGADSVISSLWSVDDESTRQLMEAFYGHLFGGGLPRHAALRRAQLDMLAHQRDALGEGLPHTWGAFVLSGEWR